MLEINRRDKISIQLENGVYQFDDESATGKTYLFKKFKEYASYGEPVRGFTYDDYLFTPDQLSVYLKDKSVKAIVIDRYDIYTGFCKKEIEEAGKDKMVMIDVKGTPSLKCELCLIELTEDGIEVY